MSWLRELADLVELRTGVVLADRQLFHGVRRFVEQRTQQIGLDKPEEYVLRVAKERDNSAEFVRLVQAVTVGYSYFFRDSDQLDVAVEVLRTLAAPGRRLQVWSAACSAGQEAWSLAILCDQAGLDVAIVATDINQAALNTATAGVYPEATLSKVRLALRTGFEACPTGGVRIVDRLRGRVGFRKHNLAAAGPYPLAEHGRQFDVILCRNVFIYFSAEVRGQVASRFANTLTAEGWLFLGPSETLEDVDVPLRAATIGRRVGYRRVEYRSARLNNLPPVPAKAAIPKTRRSLLAEAEERCKLGDLAGAESCVQTLVTETDTADAWMALGNVRLRRHDFTGAVEAYAGAKAKDALRADVHYALGVVYRKQGQIERAESALRRALFLAPEHWASAWLLAGVYRRQGRERDRRIALARARAVLDNGPPEPVSSVPHFGVEALAITPKDVGETL